MKKRFETCTVTLTPLSPIHISAGNPDYGWGAVWLPSQEKMFILDSHRFSQKLVDANLLDIYIEKVDNWLRQFNDLSEKDKEKDDYYNPCYKFIENNPLLYPDTDIINFVKELSATELHAPNGNCFIRNGDGKPYIPGSSIKGAIRTAIIYDMLQEHNKQTKKDYLNDVYLKNIFDGEPTIPKTANSGFDSRKGMDEKLLKSVLEDFQLIEKDDTGNPITLSRDNPVNGSITNLMRAILVSDSTPISKKNLADNEIKIIMLDNAVEEDGEIYRDIKRPINFTTDKGIKQCFESKQDTSVSFKITIDNEILRSFLANTTIQKFPIVFQNLDDIKKIINKFFIKVWDAEQEYYLEQLSWPNINKERMIENVIDFYDNQINTSRTNLPIINIGLGSGILCKTLFVAMKEQYKVKIRNLQMTEKQIINHNKKYVIDHNNNRIPVDWSIKLAPNSRHVVFRQNGKTSNAYRPLGWANLQFGTATYEDNVL